MGNDAWTGSLLPIGLLLLYFVPVLLGIVHVLRNDQPRIWFVVFFCMPLLGPLLYMFWPKGTTSRR